MHVPSPSGPPAPRRARPAHAASLAALGLLLLALGTPALRADDVPPAPAPVPAPAPAPPSATAPAPAATPDPLLVGTFPITPETVVDGDTLRVPGQPSIRIVGLDCEEVFHRDRDREAAKADFKAYARDKRGDSPMPVKFGTPAGEAARAFASQLLAGASALRVERDGLQGPDHDIYDRLLGHVVVIKPQGELHFALELVRAGHSPYFVKYGRARRMDAEFRAAEAEARTARRGIWASDGPPHYPDYDERLAWWQARARQVDGWRAAPDAPERIELGTHEATRRLAQRQGQPVVLFGSVGRLRLDEFPFIVFLAHKKGEDLPVVIRDRKVLEAIDPLKLSHGYVVVKGTLTSYRGKPQVEVAEAAQVTSAP
ncbi:MAG: thermonuclease family protein [Planctomycetia bacterium]